MTDIRVMQANVSRHLAVVHICLFYQFGIKSTVLSIVLFSFHGSTRFLFSQSHTKTSNISPTCNKRLIFLLSATFTSKFQASKILLKPKQRPFIYQCWTLCSVDDNSLIFCSIDFSFESLNLFSRRVAVSFTKTKRNKILKDLKDITSRKQTQ